MICYLHLRTPGKLRPFLTKKKQPFQSLLHWSFQGWIVCGDCQVGNSAVFNLCRTQQQGSWHWKWRENTSNLSWNTSIGFLWTTVLTNRFFHRRTTASMPQLYNIFKSWILAMNHHDLFDHLLVLDFAFQVWMITIPKSSSALGLSQTLPEDSRMPFLRRWENLSLLRLFTGNSSFTCCQTSDCTIIHLFVFFPAFVLHCLSFGRETVPLCATSMNFPWVFVS